MEMDGLALLFIPRRGWTSKELEIPDWWGDYVIL
jgi:hypothetical protein